MHSREVLIRGFRVCVFRMRVREELILQVIEMENLVDLAIQVLALNGTLRDYYKGLPMS